MPAQFSLQHLIMFRLPILAIANDAQEWGSIPLYDRSWLKHYREERTQHKATLVKTADPFSALALHRGSQVVSPSHLKVMKADCIEKLLLLYGERLTTTLHPTPNGLQKLSFPFLAKLSSRDIIQTKHCGGFNVLKLLLKSYFKLLVQKS